MSMLNDGTRYTSISAAATVAQAASRQLSLRPMAAMSRRWFWNQIFAVMFPPVQQVVSHLMRKRETVRMTIAIATTPPPRLQLLAVLLH